MGLLYTTPTTQRILDTLNTAFDNSKDGLLYIRALATPGSKLEDMLKKKKWAPGRLASVLKLYPYDQSPNPKPLDPKDVKRWAYFLRKVVKKQQFDEMKQALSEAILSPNFVSISFSHRELKRPGLLVIDTPVGSSLNGPFARQLILSTINVEPGNEDDFDTPTPEEPNPLPSPPWQRPKP